MIYPVKQESMENFIELWKEHIMSLAIGQSGFIRMQLLSRDGEAMAIGTWTAKADAEKFMALGPFKKLMSAVKGMLDGEPKPTIWNLSAYTSR